MAKPFTDDSLKFNTRQIPGSEAVGTVTHVLQCEKEDRVDDGHSLEVGDLVIPRLPVMGTWRSSLVLPSSSFVKVPRSRSLRCDGAAEKKVVLDELTLSTISTNPCTAYRLLQDFLPKKDDPTVPKDRAIIQNGGASSVGLAVSQLAFVERTACVSIVRRGNRSDAQLQELMTYLYNVGKNTLVLVEEELLSMRTSDLVALVKDLPPIVLGLNCVGGKSVDLLVKLLRKGGTVVTYGGLSKRPVTVPTGRLIFNDLVFRGYWHSAWLVHDHFDRGTGQERSKMLQAVVNAVCEGDLVLGKRKVFDLNDFVDALKWNESQNTAIRSKVVFRCSEN